MTYLITEIALYLGAAALIGFLTGWFSQRARRAHPGAARGRRAEDSREIPPDFSREMQSLTSKLEEQEREAAEMAARMSAEIEQLRASLESQESSRPEDPGRHKSRNKSRNENRGEDQDENQGKNQDERGDQGTKLENLESERNQVTQQYEGLAAKHRKLQEQYERATERIVSLEKERFGERGGRSSAASRNISASQAAAGPRPSSGRVKPFRSSLRSATSSEQTAEPHRVASAPPEPSAASDLSRTPTASAPPEPPAAPLASDGREPEKEILAKEHLPFIERSAGDSFFGRAEKGEGPRDGEAGGREAASRGSSTGTDELILEPPIVAAENPPQQDSLEFEAPSSDGASHPLDAIEGLPTDIIARLKVLGLTTNLDLLRKCGTRSGLNAVSTSMRLKVEDLALWTSSADLLRLSRIRREDVDALVSAGLDSVQALSTNTPENVLQKLKKARKGRGGNKVPDSKVVGKWIEEAKELSAMIRW